MSEEENTLMTVPVSALSDSIDSVDAQIEALKDHRARLMDEVEARFFAGFFAQLPNGIGTAHIIKDGVRVTCNVVKKVTWDEKILQSMAHQMSWQEANDTFKIKFSLPEKAYNDLTGDMRKMTEHARTVTPGKPKYTLTEAE